MTDNDKNLMNDDELESVSGGVNVRAGAGGTNSQDNAVPQERHFCKHCDQDQIFIVYSGSRPVCKVCGNAYTFGV